MPPDFIARTFFFCLRHASQARPVGTPGMAGVRPEWGERRVDLKTDTASLQGRFDLVRSTPWKAIKSYYIAPRKEKE